MNKLKVCITLASVLTIIQYLERLPDRTMIEVGMIVVTTNASYQEWGGLLNQEVVGTKKRQPARFESSVWIKTEKNYDAGKLECWTVLKIFKKFWWYLYGAWFVLEVDAATLMAQLNHLVLDLSNYVIICWISWIHLFDFNVKHVPGMKNTVADGLSQQPSTEEDL